MSCKAGDKPFVMGFYILVDKSAMSNADSPYSPTSSAKRKYITMPLKERRKIVPAFGDQAEAIGNHDSGALSLRDRGGSLLPSTPSQFTLKAGYFFPARDALCSHAVSHTPQYRSIMLCDVCRKIGLAEDGQCELIRVNGDMPHHQTLASLQQSVTLGCYVCNALWDSLPRGDQQIIIDTGNAACSTQNSSISQNSTGSPMDSLLGGVTKAYWTRDKDDLSYTLFLSIVQHGDGYTTKGFSSFDVRTFESRSRSHQILFKPSRQRVACNLSLIAPRRLLV